MSLNSGVCDQVWVILLLLLLLLLVIIIIIIVIIIVIVVVIIIIIIIILNWAFFFFCTRTGRLWPERGQVICTKVTKQKTVELKMEKLNGKLNRNEMAKTATTVPQNSLNVNALRS